MTSKAFMIGTSLLIGALTTAIGFYLYSYAQEPISPPLAPDIDFEGDLPPTGTSLRVGPGSVLPQIVTAPTPEPDAEVPPTPEATLPPAPIPPFSPPVPKNIWPPGSKLERRLARTFGAQYEEGDVFDWKRFHTVVFLSESKLTNSVARTPEPANAQDAYDYLTCKDSPFLNKRGDGKVVDMLLVLLNDRDRDVGDEYPLMETTKFYLRWGKLHY
ncbi:hypothetical protein B9479_007855 [Cryptococcus floricola]|uniref:Uncharacterized protein n=1 Tax=Cryptococcus floricola TaxID=2591691 RepID=A0A5D3ALA9_9TREE|nr:hypothetical protein B9479_007855 [Cryptococcus floricola]